MPDFGNGALMVRTWRDGGRDPRTEWALFLKVDKENRSGKPLRYKNLGFEILKIFPLKGYFCVLTKCTTEPDSK